MRSTRDSQLNLLRLMWAGPVLCFATVTAPAAGAQRFPIPIRLPSIPQAARAVQQHASDAALEARCTSFLKWSRQLDSAYVGRDLYRSVITPAMLAPLFTDGAFVPFFGKPYAQFSPDDRQTYWTGTIAPCFQSSQHRSDFNWQRQPLPMAFQARAFRTATSAEQLVPAAAAVQQARDALGRYKSQIASMPADAGAYDQLMSIKRSAQPPLQLVWPTEQNDFTAALTTSLARTAGSTLHAKIDPVIAGAAGYDGLLALQRVPVQYKDLLAVVAPDERAQYQRRVDERSGRILDGLMTEEDGKVARLGSGAAGLRDGAQWYERFHRSFASFETAPRVQTVLEHFHTKRRAQIAGATPEVARLIRTARTEDEVDGVLAQYLSLPDDVGAAHEMTALADERKSALHKRQVLGTETVASGGEPVASPEPTRAARPRARAESARPRTSDASGGDGGPTSGELYDVLQARVTAWNENMKNIARECSNLHAHTEQNPVLGIQCLSYFAASNGNQYTLKQEITRFEKVECSKAQGRPGYVCDYIVATSIDSQKFSGTLGRLVEGASVTEARFLHTGNGWIMAPER